MKVHKHNVAMRWITRRRTIDVAGLYESFPGTFSAYQEALSGGFQGTMEEFIQLQSIPQSDRPFTGAVGGRVQYNPGGLVEPGVVNYGKKSYYQRMQEKNPGYFYKIKTKTFKIGDKTYKIGEAIKPNQITSLKEGLKKITQWKKNPTPGNWTELFRTPSKSGQTHQSEFSLNLRKYLSDKKIPPKTKKLFDLINIKSTVGTKTANSIKTFQADNAFWKSAQTIKNIKIGKNVKEGSMAHINAIRDAFVWNPDSELDDLAKFMYGEDFTKANPKQKLKIVNEISNDVPKFLEALDGARMVKNFNMPNDDIALDIIDNIQSNKKGFKFKEGTLRNYKFNIRDAGIMLPEGTTLADRNRLMKLKKGMGLAIDETGGLSATYQRAPGYTSGSQLIDNLLNKKKRTLIDKDFSNVLRAMVDGDPNAMYQWQGEEVTRDELVKNNNEHAEKFKKKYKIDGPTIQIGVNPKKAVSNYGLYSKAEQANMQNIFKTKKFSIGFGKETKPLKFILDSFWCGRKAAAEGGRIGFKAGSGCPVEVRQRNFLALTDDVAKGRVTGEAAEQIAKNAAKVVGKAGSKSALLSVLGPAGFGLDIAFEVGSIGTDMAVNNVSLKEAMQNNWLTGFFMKGTGQEEYHKGLFAKDSSAKPYGAAMDLFARIEEEEKTLKRMITGSDRVTTTEEMLSAQKDKIADLYSFFNKLARKEGGRYLALEQGSPEQVAYEQAKLEYDSGREATAALKRTSQHGIEQMIKEGAQKRPYSKYGYEAPEKYGEFTKNQLDQILKGFGSDDPNVSPQTFGFKDYADLSTFVSNYGKTQTIAEAGGVANMKSGGKVEYDNYLPDPDDMDY